MAHRRAHRPDIRRHALTRSPPPADLDQLPTPDGVLDDDWLASLSEPDDAEPTIRRDARPRRAPRRRPTRGAPSRRAEPSGDDGHRIAAGDRLLELNEQAAAFFTARYRDSWAPAYLADRLGTDLPTTTGSPSATPPPAGPR